MPLHSSKKEALIQLTNCMSSCNVKAIKQLSDGKIFLSVIETVFPETALRHSQSEEERAVKQEEDDPSRDGEKAMDQDSNASETTELCSVAGETTEVAAEEETESPATGEESAAQAESAAESVVSELIDVVSVEEKEPPEPISTDREEEVVPPPVVNAEPPLPVEHVDVKDEDVSKRYEFIESFIDEKYHLQSGKLIAYEECRGGSEFELAKVALFVLSEVVQQYVRVNDPMVQTLSLLDLKVQQDLKDCFHLFINERSRLNETDIRKLLSSRTSHKVSPAKSSFITPKRSCSSKYKRSTSPSSSSPPFFDNFADSPLKTYFESPIFTKKDIVTKDKEILRTRQHLYEEEVKSSTLQQQVKELEKELKKKGKEINSLKTRIKEMEEVEKPGQCEECAVLSEKLKLKEKELSLKEAAVEEEHEKIRRSFEDEFERYKTKVAQELVKIRYEQKRAEQRNWDLECEREEWQFRAVKSDLSHDQLVEELREKSKECELLQEKLSAALKEAAERTAEYSIRGECLGGVIDRENEELRQRVEELQSMALSKEKNREDAMVQCTEDSFDSVAVIVEKNPREDCPRDACDIDNSSPSSFVVPFIPDHLSPVRSESVGALWQQYNDSATENTTTTATQEAQSGVEKRIQRAISALQTFETEFRKDKRFRSRGPNGSNGLVVGSIVVKELVEDLKSVKNSLLCLTTEDVELLNNNSALSRRKTDESNSCDASVVTLGSECDACSKRKGEALESAALLEKTKELDALYEQYLEKTKQLDVLNEQYVEKSKKFDILNEQCLTTVASLHNKEKELHAFKKRYILERKENFQNLKSLRDVEMQHQRLQLELKGLQKGESELKRTIRKERTLFKLQLKAQRERTAQLQHKDALREREFRSFQEKYKRIVEEEKSRKDEHETLLLELKALKCEKDELKRRLQFWQKPSTSIELEPRFMRGGLREHHARPIPNPERPHSPNDEDSSSTIDVEENMTASALYAKNLKNPFQLHTADEESFLNHSSIAGLSRHCDSEESVSGDHQRRSTLCPPSSSSCAASYREEGRASELNRRNTLCMPHLRSCYPAEGVPLNPPRQHASHYVDYEVPDDVPQEESSGESASREPAGKKRKVSETETRAAPVEPQPQPPAPSEVVQTPSSRIIRRSKLKFVTPQSISKLLKLTGSRGSRRPNKPIKPKPE